MTDIGQAGLAAGVALCILLMTWGLAPRKRMRKGAYPVTHSARLARRARLARNRPHP